MKRALATCVVLVAAAIQTDAQQTRDGQAAPPGTGAISGIVRLADFTEGSVRRATVELTGGGLTVEKLLALTDDTGRFSFSQLPPGRYQVTARKAAFLPAAFGASRPLGEGTPIVVAAGQHVNALTLPLFRGGVMTGMVTDDRSVPVPYVNVRAFRYALSPETGETRPELVSMGTPEVLTDDQGRFRLYGLAPGDYVVSAAPAKREVDGAIRQITEADIDWAKLLIRTPNGAAATLIDRRTKPVPVMRLIGNAPVFYSSGDSVAGATRITLRVAEERPAVDVLLRIVRTATVSGSVSGPSAVTRNGGRITLIDESSTFQAATRWQSDTSFQIPGVPPGRYSVFASSEGQPYRGRADIFVDGQDVRAFVSLQPGTTLSGRVVFDEPGTTGQALPSLSLMSLGQSEVSTRSTSVRPDGTFAFGAFPMGTYRLTAAMPANLQPGWRVKSAMRGDVDLLDTVLVANGGESIGDVVVTLVRSRSEIAGRMLSADGTAATRYSIIVFSADPQLRGIHSRRTQMVRPATDGRFVARDLPAGDYLISAVNDVERGQWHNKAFLAELAPYGVQVALADGEKKVQDIKLGSGG